MTETMRTVHIPQRGHPEFTDTPVPTMQPGHVLVKTQHLSLCGSDIRYLHHLPDYRYPVPAGSTGHEMVGVIADPGDSAFAEGEVVLALAPNHRAMAPYYLAEAANVLRIPAGCPPTHALQAQQLGTAIYAAKALPSLIGKSVAVIGQGSAGLYFVWLARRMGARNVIGIDLQPQRLVYAQRYGATSTVHNDGQDMAEAVKAVNDGELGDVVVEAAGEEITFQMAIDIAAKEGFVLFFGVPRAESFDMPMLAFFKKYLTAKGIVDATREPNHASTRLALDYIARGEIDVGQLITHTFPFDAVLEAYELHRTRDEGAVKIVVEMP